MPEDVPHLGTAWTHRGRSMCAQTAIARLKGGRPVKSIDETRKKDNELTLIVSKNEIASIFAKEKKLCEKRLPRGRLGRIIAEVKLRNNLLDDTPIEFLCIRLRVKKQRTCVLQSHPGISSPLGS